MATTVKSIEQRLLKKGTAAGPVSQEMIETAKHIYNSVIGTETKPDRFGWLDFLSVARERISQRIKKPR